MLAQFLAILEVEAEYRTHARLSRAYINFSSVSVGFFFEVWRRFFDVMGLYLRESNTWERLNLARVRYLNFLYLRNNF